MRICEAENYMTVLRRSAIHPGRHPSTANQPNSKVVWGFPKGLARVAISIGIAAAFVCVPGAIRVLAQEAQPAEVKDTVDPDAVDALNKMSAYLKTLKSFQVISNVTNDDVLDDGEIIQKTSKVDLLAAKPDRLRVEVTSDDKHRLYLYDGKDFTVWARLVNYYATVPAPPTIGKLIVVAYDKYGIDLPLIDLFRWGDNDEGAKKLTSAVDIGPSTVEDVTCEHYAFRQPGADWQIWIQLGEFPLPRKLVIRTLTDDARPQHGDILTWNLAPSFNNEAFVFNPPPDAKKIVLAQETADSTEKDQ
jgi:hypothetical protein